MLTPGDAAGLAAEGTALVVVQLVAAAVLVVGGILALARRTRPVWLLLGAALAVQLLLALYWSVRVVALLSDLPGPDPTGVFLAGTFAFAAAPAVALGLLLSRPARRWFDAESRA